MSLETPRSRAQPDLTDSSLLTVEVRVQQAQQDCWLYSWDRQQDRLRVTGKQPAQPTLPADLALLSVEGQKDIPVYILATPALTPGALVTIRLIGALQISAIHERGPSSFPLEGWTLIGVPHLADSPAAWTTLDQIPSEQLTALLASVQQAAPTPEVALRPPAAVAQRLREARRWLKQARYQQTQRKKRAVTQEEESQMIWHTISGLTPEQRTGLARAKTLEELTPFLQPEQLIRLVPLRFQQALANLLTEEERVLAFLQRPLLRHRSGLFGMRQWRSNEGLFLLTDRQILWLRDFFSPGSSALTEGYIAHAAPLERLTHVAVWPPGAAPAGVTALEARSSPYTRLALAIASLGGSEWFVVDVPPGTATEKALARLAPLLHAFLPCDEGQQDRRVRCLPFVEAWMPSGLEQERLANLGGIVPQQSRQRLEQRLAEYLSATGEDLLVSALIPALEAYRSPARLVALTRQAVLVLNEIADRPLLHIATHSSERVTEHRYDLTHISSAQIS
ncbi:MAG: hypothetical protein IMW89_12185, partial [Ktedonobacteraceae bacterium]|nr:hypothetical protein [Ktedonobacteraceae bacterium]